MSTGAGAASDGVLGRSPRVLGSRARARLLGNDGLIGVAPEAELIDEFTQAGGGDKPRYYERKILPRFP